MKTRIVFITVGILICATLKAQFDTTTIKWNKGKILIISEKGDSTIEIKPNTKNDENAINKSKKFKGKWAALELGLTGYLTPSGSFALPNQLGYLDLNIPKSINFNLNLFEHSITIIPKKTGIVTGLGLAWHRYRFNRQTILFGDAYTLAFTYDSLVKKSQLNIVYLRLPLFLEFHIPINQSKDKLYIAGGVVGSLRIKSYNKSVYFPGSDKKLFKNNDDFHLMPVNYSFELRFGINNVGIYINYMPVPLFKSGKGPELYPWASGISLNF
ncbi:MAG: hypothetical protein N2449_01875 [Bacteroidales bacterium]|nr:hypothetical protein [Bacteroidales bacterium]